MVRKLVLIGLLCSGIASADSRQRAVELLNTLQMTRVGQGVKPASLELKQPRVGAEILEIQSPTSIRAWISPAITREEFAALEVDQGWRKNQPRTSSECGPDEGRFLKSPDASEDGDILVQPFYGYEWFHSATIFATGVPVDTKGLLRGSRVRKYHELSYLAGSCMVLLVSPEDEVYFRINRDADRTTDDFSLPAGWRLKRYTPLENLRIELFDETLVIRADNEDSFQGPVPALESAL